VIPDRTSLFVLIVSLSLIVPAQRVLSEQTRADRLEIEKQKCIELIEMLEGREM